MFLLFSFISYLVNFTVYSIIDRYLIQPFNRMQAEKKSEEPAQEEDFSGLFAQIPEEPDEDEDRYVYVNGKLVKKSQVKDEDNWFQPL